MLRVALTGGLACGKSVCGRCFAGHGAAVIDADEVAHALLMPGQAVCDEVIAAFGPEIVAGNGGVDRRLLGKLVFDDPAARRRLNGLMHPAVLAALERWAGGCKACDERVVIAQIPLLYEVAQASAWQRVVCVVAPDAAVMSRLLERGLSEDEARQRLAAQWPVMDKMERADYVIYNAGTEDLLMEQVARVWRCLRSEAYD
ncbi:MAG: dephospho-CoA kinase [bacterium]